MTARRKAKGRMPKAKLAYDKESLECIARNATRSAGILRKLRMSIRAVLGGKTLTTQEAKHVMAARLAKKRA